MMRRTLNSTGHALTGRTSNWSEIPKTADATIRGFCSLIEARPKLERHLWNAAKLPDFSIGVQAGARPHSTGFVLAAETVTAAHELGARVVFTHLLAFGCNK